MNIPIIIGIVGTTILVVTFILNENHKLTVDDLTFDLLHLVGSICLVIYALYAEVYIFVILNGVAVLVSLNDSIKALRGIPRAKNKTAIIRQKRNIKNPFFHKIKKILIKDNVKQ